ncbi:MULTISPECIES: L-threonylcarbamoyladenylate synthase [Alphaproteobacteria]|uniref:Threonylcarbamoyl-AMP synthase n=2 Tax=Alphaproteobacteria TaxID=28211 RepID=A0A512HF53_9HYPH|nr:MULTISPECIES: L-threonylcarbamoyladenylate synthase [Alphaproteobacteria]GEO84089.1 threonylcarbamoyl-AMP synthase [Ciceribacter naphthalenivorans]GLR24625.1 threonylcarbamoyl-AMP synthase [Ciceribacter naphthalenivorans]GLT07481.1 threonylcarbamoyl-AMP synthase [Sphingomonas psychrolutea]
MARIIPSDPDEQAAIDAAITVLSRARPVAIPTETVYGLAADATDAGAITSIYETKGRPRFNPLICHMADLAMAERYAIFDPISRQLARRFWPGPLTLVLPLQSASTIHPLATAGLDSVGIRVPKGFAGALIRAFGRPLAAPSANSSGRISPTTAAHVDADLGARIDLIVDGGPCPVGVESTIIKVEDGRIRLLRPGGVPVEAIEAETGLTVERPKAAGTAAIEAPGMLASHYAPNAHVRLDATSVSAGEALIRFGDQPVEGMDMAVAVFDLSPLGNLAEAAANLFGLLKRADQTDASGIAITPIPDYGLGEAINDRLKRAAAPRDA